MSSIFSKTDFGVDFKWGVSSSALQTEGAYQTDGKGPSIWDEFAQRKKSILHHDTPKEACNFYELYEADILQIKYMGIPNFRFSIAWSRIIPEGIGTINHKGIAYYHKVIDACLKNGIEPWITLYHWDLPLALEKQGGWTNRNIISWFENYIRICVNEFKDKVKYWMVLNEPMVFTGAGYFLGVHAPGRKRFKNFLPALHHAVLCQARGINLIKELQPESIVGTTYSCSYISPHSNSNHDKKAAERVDTLLNHTFIEPMLGLGYPIDRLPMLKKILKYIHPGDELLMTATPDFIGIQNYTREVVKHSHFAPYMKARIIPADKRKVYHTAMDWEVYPEGVYMMIKKYHSFSGVKSIIVTENGASFPDSVVDGNIDDDDRLEYLKSYIEQVLRAKEEGLKIDGYFVWSLTDNFEWAEGYKQRFGLIHVDFKSQKRTLKKSGYWYKDFLK